MPAGALASIRTRRWCGPLLQVLSVPVYNESGAIHQPKKLVETTIHPAEASERKKTRDERNDKDPSLNRTGCLPSCSKQRADADHRWVLVWIKVIRRNKNGSRVVKRTHRSVGHIDQNPSVLSLNLILWLRASISGIGSKSGKIYRLSDNGEPKSSQNQVRMTYARFIEKKPVFNLVGLREGEQDKKLSEVRTNDRARIEQAPAEFDHSPLSPTECWYGPPPRSFWAKKPLVQMTRPRIERGPIYSFMHEGLVRTTATGLF
ncbi:hypothetical protein C8R45DRAFT_929808 [Mycena sanguinolenta]|nr:hypothetical protein C8R45DRAFT_929808 [Mycena sanguinolenta]